MSYTSEQKRILRQERFDAFATGYKKGCFLSIFVCGIALFSLSFCANRPIDNKMLINKGPVTVKKATPNVKTQKEQHTK